MTEHDGFTVERDTDRATATVTLAVEGKFNRVSMPARDELRAMFEDVYGRDMTHEVGPVAVGPDSVGYAVRCTYGDGTKVLCVSAAQLRDGRIARETIVQSWDS